MSWFPWFDPQRKWPALTSLQDDTVQIKLAVRILNRAFNNDPVAVERLVKTEVPCNLHIATMDHIVNEDERDNCLHATGLGLLNGVLGPITGHIVVVLVQDGKMKGFGYQKSYSA